jgi:hypothetical protein
MVRQTDIPHNLIEFGFRNERVGRQKDVNATGLSDLFGGR